MNTLKIITRKEALAQGLKRYFTGKPCKHGHVCQRNVKGGCVECGKIWLNAYCKANKGKIKGYHKEYSRANKDKINARSKAWQEANKDKIKAYYKANKDKIKARSKVYYEAKKKSN